ncbi:MAG: tetratricopeptide repeat protein [Chloroflexia bacterium]|nr:tetratricopeptide repeat protein [Chloroflexia bacterium]
MEEPESSIGQVDGRIQKAVEHLREGRPAEAVETLEALVEREPENAAAYQELAAAQFKLLRFKPAAAAAQRALELDPSLHRPHGILAWIALNRRRYDEAEAALRAQLGALPQDEPGHRAAVHNQLGFLYFRRRRYDEAKAALGRALQLVPERAVPRFNLAMLYLRTRQRGAAQEELERLLALPELPDRVAHAAHFNLGHLYARQGRYGTTRRHFAQALQHRPSVEGYVYRALPWLARLPRAAPLAVLFLFAVVGWILLK